MKSAVSGDHLERLDRYYGIAGWKPVLQVGEDLLLDQIQTERGREDLVADY